MIHIRRAGPLDPRAMAELLNEIIALGGTTAITSPVTAAGLAHHMETVPRNAWHVAEADDGTLLGFQWVEQIDSLPPEAASIATFARVGRTGLGIGSALFEATKETAKDLGYRWISADIRADNTGGLAYYQSRGFEEYGRKTGVRLDDGSTVDKVLKRFDL